MIKIDIDMDKCQHYGQCVFEAEDIFQLTATETSSTPKKFQTTAKTMWTMRLTSALCRRSALLLPSRD